MLIGLLAAGLPINPTLLRALRVARVARVLRTVKSARAIKQLLTTLFLSLPAISNISSIFLILQFLFAVLGMQLFAHVAWGEHLNADANFCSFATALTTMFRCATGESFNGIMHDRFDWTWGDNRLKCCPECGPMLDGPLRTHDGALEHTFSGALDHKAQANYPGPQPRLILARLP